MEDDLQEFDDPALKAAIVSAFRHERAPAELRGRMASLLSQEANPRYWTRRRILSYALAASVLLYIGGTIYLFLPKREKAVPDWFADAMITTHNNCVSLADHHLLANIPDNDLVAERKYLRETLGHPALAAMLDDGWKFKGAGVCQIANVPASHFLFEKDGDTISIFSVTTALLYSNHLQDGEEYSETRNGVQIAGFVYGGAIHCLLGESRTRKLTLGGIIAMRDQLRASPAGIAKVNGGLRIAH